MQGGPGIKVLDRIDDNLGSQYPEPGAAAFDALTFQRGPSDAEVICGGGGAQVTIGMEGGLGRLRVVQGEVCRLEVALFCASQAPVACDDGISVKN